MGSGSKDAILEAAKQIAQAHGYNGLNFRDIAEIVGIRAASIYHHFPSKADLGAAVAKLYWETTASRLELMRIESPDPLHCLRLYPDIFRRALEHGNRMCLCSFMAAEYDDLPEAVKTEVQRFTDVNVAWLSKILQAATSDNPSQASSRAHAIFAAIAGAQLMARSRADIGWFDRLIDTYRATGLLPA